MLYIFNFRDVFAQFDALIEGALLTLQLSALSMAIGLVLGVMKRAPNREFDLKFVIRRSPAHMGVRMGEHSLVRWLDSFIFFNAMNGELDKLHQKWLAAKMAPLPTL